MGGKMDNKQESERDFLEILCLLEQGYGKNRVITEYVRRLARLVRGKWKFVKIEVGGGGPSVRLNIRTKGRIIDLSVDLSSKANFLMLKKYTNEKNDECQNTGQEEPGTSDTES
jgi:hypothetical protein